VDVPARLASSPVVPLVANSFLVLRYRSVQRSRATPHRSSYRRISARISPFIARWDPGGGGGGGGTGGIQVGFTARPLASKKNWPIWRAKFGIILVLSLYAPVAVGRAVPYDLPRSGCPGKSRTPPDSPRPRPGAAQA